MKVIFWGTGETAIKNISRIKGFCNQFEVVAFTDSFQEYAERESLFQGFKLISPQMLSCTDVDYLCILSIWEWEIRRKIYEEKLFDLERIVSFYEICMMGFGGKDIKKCYESLLDCVHPRQVDLLLRWRDYAYLKRKYSYVLCDRDYYKTNMDKKICIEDGVKPIWILWLQGYDQAPELVKVCMESMQRALHEKEQIFLLDKENLFDYIEFPQYIVEKWRAGIINNTHFSDLTRVRLLNVYGGVWIDATVYFTGNELPGYIKSSKLFLFHRYPDWENCAEPRIMASWLISAEPGNKILSILESMFYEYWKEENHLVNYFIFHICMYIIAECFPDEWKQIEKVPRAASLLLSRECNNKFNSSRFEHIKEMTDFHKLSYKAPYAENGKDNFWNEICKMEKKSGKDQM